MKTANLNFSVKSDDRSLMDCHKRPQSFTKMLVFLSLGGPNKVRLSLCLYKGGDTLENITVSAFLDKKRTGWDFGTEY